MHFKRRPSRRPLLFAALILLVIAAIWWFVTGNRPQVTAVFPEAGAFAIPAQAPLRLTFDRPMNLASVEPALQSSPERSGTFTWDENTLTFTPDEAWPRGATISVTLTTAAATSAGIHLGEPFVWSFRTAPTLLAYLWPAGDTETTRSDLYALDPLTGDVARLTESEYGVLDYSLDPDGLGILLSLANRNGGADIARLDLLSRTVDILLECGQILCTTPVFDPTRTWLAYADATAGEIVLLDETFQSTRLGTGRFPAWSSNSLLLAYDPGQEAYFIFDPRSGSRSDFSNSTGEPAVWWPDGSYFLAPDIKPIAVDAFASHLMRFGRTGRELLDLTLDPLADDNAPTVSPDGARIAFARRSLGPQTWTPGRQLWIMDPDGRNAAALTSAGVFNHTAFAWHPDSSQIAYVRSDQADLNEPPEIWLIGLDGSPPIQLVIAAYAPTWIP